MAIDSLAPRDDNRITVIMGTDINTVTSTRVPIVVGVDATTHRLLVSAIITSGGSGGGGTEYTDAAVPPAHPVGGTLEWSDGSNWQTVSTAKPLPVTIQSNASINNAQIAGNATSVGVGASGNGTQRLVLANDAGKTLVSKGGSVASSGDNTLVTAGTNRLKVYAFSLSTTSTTSVTCIFQSGAGGTELWRVVLQAVTGSSTGANLPIQPPAWLFATASATLLNLNLSGAQTVHWSVSYFDEA